MIVFDTAEDERVVSVERITRKAKTTAGEAQAVPQSPFIPAFPPSRGQARESSVLKCPWHEPSRCRPRAGGDP